MLSRKPIFYCLIPILTLKALTSVGEDLAAARACVTVADRTSRLACYDAAFALAPPTPTAEFGINQQLQNRRAVTLEIPKKVDALVTRSVPLGRELYQLTLDNGQVWVTKEGDWALHLESGNSVTIVRMPLGGYQLSQAGNPHTVIVRRVE